MQQAAVQQAICSPMEVVSFWSSNWRGTTASLDRKRFRLHSAISLGEQDDYLAKDLLVRSRIGSRTHMPRRGAAAHRQARQHGGGRANDRLPQRNDGGDPNSTRWPSGHVVVDNVYATYQYPAAGAIPIPSCLIPEAGIPRGSTTPRPTAAKAGSRSLSAKDLRFMAWIARIRDAPEPTSARSTR